MLPFDFFIEKYTIGLISINDYKERLDKIKEAVCMEKPVVAKPERIKQLNFYDLFERYEYNAIVENTLVCEGATEYYQSLNKHSLAIDITKNVLICNVKKDNWDSYLDGTARIYYTGKKFPLTIELDKLYYFMPYLSGKGIRDLYFIKAVRLGNRKEGQKNEDKNDIRLVFEIERVGQLLDEYKRIKLEVWRTFTDIKMKEVLNMIK